jgi:hypothetical protein
MKKLALILLANVALCTAPAFAQQSAPASAAASGGTGAGGGEKVNTPGDHQSLCSKDNPYIEYRDCVNANTRDKNAKVRLA